MENSRIINFIFTLFLAGLLFVAPFMSWAYDDKKTHPALTAEIIKFYKRSFFEDKLNDMEKEFVIQGSIDEDTGIRWMHHYYDPVFNRGLTLGSNKSVNPNLAFVGGAPLTSQWSSSKEWAQSSPSQSGLTGLMGSLFQGYFSSKDDYSWERGIYEYAWGNKQHGLESLGHVLHLMEDASVPDHTRNDPHPGLENSLASAVTPDVLLNYLGSHDVTNGSPYEGYAIFGRGSLNIAQEIENEKPIIANTLDEYFTRIATYSNNYFFSGDTIIGSPYHSPKIENLEIRTEKLSNDKDYKFGYIKDNQGNSFKIVKITDNVLVNDPYSIKDIDNKIMKEYWTFLSRQAVLHGAGVVKLFFDEVEKEKQTKTLYDKNRSWVSKTYDSFTQAAFGAANLLYIF
ncbi:MAG: hypothetical protein Q8R24_01170, partial [Legionellaceae bacterium]|nr:hypothetical protein [Legionellaceae bacterium]